ncbi:Cell wall integrity and stress response component 4 [Rhizina undulata]
MKRTPPNLSVKRQDTASRQEMKLMKYRIQGQNHERETGVRRRGFVRGTYWLQLATIVIFSLCMAEKSWALDIEYCSSINTASDSANYAFAVLQGTRCWCSNYAPSTNTTGCDTGCPGYDLEYCGSTTNDLYGYIALAVAASGTLSAAPATTTTSTQTTTSESSTQTTKGSTADTTSTPSVLVVTSVGGFKTITLGAAETSSSSTKSDSSTNSSSSASATAGSSSFFSNPGRVAGVFVGIGLVILGIVAGLLYFRHRRNRQQSLYGDNGSGIIQAGGAGFIGGNRRRSRSMSTLGLVGEKGLGTADSTPSGHGYSNSTGTAGAVAPLMDGTSAPIGRIVDQRLDPYVRFDNDPSSRMSVKSLRDDQDYTRRVLRLANPDAE